MEPQAFDLIYGVYVAILLALAGAFTFVGPRTTAGDKLFGLGVAIVAAVAPLVVLLVHVESEATVTGGRPGELVTLPAEQCGSYLNPRAAIGEACRERLEDGATLAKQLAAGGTLILLVGIGYEVHRHKSIDGAN